MHKVIVALVLLTSLLLPSTAAAASVRIPTSAADWASFSASERSATMAWVWAQYDRLRVADKLVGGVATTMSAQASAATATGDVACGINQQNYPWGSYTSSWAQAYASQSMFAIDTGLTANQYGYWDTFYRNGNVIHQFGSGGGGYSAYAQSFTDFKFPWEMITYSIQAYGTAQQTPGVWVYYLKPCYK